MDWRSRFNAAFLLAWRDAGLPLSASDGRRYDDLRRAMDVPDDLLADASHNSGPLTPSTVRDVYVFGVFIGQVAGRLLGLPAGDVRRCADWCGRFNLGISLFDYLSDQAQPDEDPTAWARFARLASRGPSSSPGRRTSAPQSAAAQVLDRVAADVMTRLEAAVGPLDRDPADAIWIALAEMMRAELLMAQTPLAANPDVERLTLAARRKSTGPFCCMAEWLSVSSRPGDAASRAQARALGEALGDCFWLVDDARDLWEDLDAGRWNLFLLMAAQADPALFADRGDPSSEIQLSRIVMARGWVEQIVTPVIARARHALDSMPASSETRDEVAGVLAVSMERWLR